MAFSSGVDFLEDIPEVRKEKRRQDGEAFAKAFYNSQEWIRLARAYREKHFFTCEHRGRHAINRWEEVRRVCKEGVNGSWPN